MGCWVPAEPALQLGMCRCSPQEGQWHAEPRPEGAGGHLPAAFLCPKASIRCVFSADDKAKPPYPHFGPLKCHCGPQGWSNSSPLCLPPDPKAALKTKPCSCFNLRNGSDLEKSDSALMIFQGGVKPPCSQKDVGGGSQ